MPYRFLGDLRALDKHGLFDSGECVDLIKALVPGLIGVSTQVWRKGAAVKDTPGLARGTAMVRQQAPFDGLDAAGRAILRVPRPVTLHVLSSYH